MSTEYGRKGEAGTPDVSDSAKSPSTKGPVKTPRPKTGRSSVQLFDKENGLKALTAAKAVISHGPLRLGGDGQFWAYEGGVWVPDKHDRKVSRRIVNVLGERYRPAHKNAVVDVTRALIDDISAEPVPQFINFTNGLLDWRTGELHPHSPDVPTTVQLSIPWNANAQCGRFNAFLEDVIADDDRPRVWEVIGYMLMSGNPLHKAFLLAGGGRNGKGAFMRTVLALLGKANVSNVPLHDLSTNRFATAQLYGKMANVCGDIDATYLENTGRIKEITGEDHVQAEHKFGQPFGFTAWCSMLFSANSIPGSADSSKGWVDRWEIIPFPKYVGDRVDRGLEPALQAEESLQGIAAQAVAALRVLMDRQSFRVTEAGKTAKEEFARKSNPVIAWLEERCTLTAKGWEKAPVLYQDYRTWAIEIAGQKTPMSRPNFYEKLRQLGEKNITPAKRGVEGFKGISLGQIEPTVTPAPEPVKEEPPASLL